MADEHVLPAVIIPPGAFDLPVGAVDVFLAFERVVDEIADKRMYGSAFVLLGVPHDVVEHQTQAFGIGRQVDGVREKIVVLAALVVGLERQRVKIPRFEIVARKIENLVGDLLHLLEIMVFFAHAGAQPFAEIFELVGVLFSASPAAKRK